VGADKLNVVEVDQAEVRALARQPISCLPMRRWPA
jgi:hypothetical protein